MELINGYPEYMRDMIHTVEKTRQDRIKKALKMMTLDEREAVLTHHHPDYNPATKRTVKAGVNKGDKMPHEVADLLEARSLISPDEIDLSKIDYDVDLLIIGGGGAGIVAALWANQEGVPADNILIATKLRLGDSNSMMAQGGIQAADKPNDSITRHYLDVMGGGHFENKPDLVEALVSDAPLIIKWHEDLGVMYDKEKDGTMVTIHGGGTSRKRMHSAKDYTGMEIIRVLRDEMRNKKIPILEFAPAVELIKDDKGQVAGAVLFNMETDQYYVVRAKATIITTGGFGRLHIQNFPTTNHYGATADGLVMAYRAGANLRDMDSVQYHPTGAIFPEQIVGLLITEKVRGLGAQPLNIDGELFVNPLEPRDVESAAFIRECYERNKGVETHTGLKGVWLDTPLIDIIHGKGTIEKKLSAMYRMYARFGIDMTKDPILVYPTLHYQNGGIEINADGTTKLPGLFVAGEASGGVHGKNRLMGNSVLDYNVFGRRAGIAVAKHVKKASVGKLTLEHVKDYEKTLDNEGVKTDRESPMIIPDYREKSVLSRMIDVWR
ncbi:MAG: FAD-binding protein [Thermoplasmata archaeon]